MSQSLTVRRFLLFITILSLLGLRSVAAPEEAALDEKTLRDAKVGTDGPDLLAFLRARTLTDEDGKKLKALVRQLGSDSFREREKATAALLAYGRLALPYLREGAADADAEIVRRSRRCIEAVEAGPGPALPIAALHLIARRQPEGAAEVLLRYLPFADDSYVEEEASAALGAVAVRGGTADQAVVKALRDELPLRRAAAASALGRVKNAAIRAPVRKLLADPVGRVRLEAAHALLLAGEGEAVPALIELLRDSSSEIAGQAESLLFLAAGEKAPQASAGDGSAEARKQWRDAWAAWWKATGDGLDLSRIGERRPMLGLVLVAETNGANKVWEYGRDRKERWKVAGLNWPMDVHGLPGGNVLVADMSTRGVAEYDRAGKLLWQKAVPGGANAAQRLANGHTFLCTSEQLLEVDRTGKEVAGHKPNQGTITDAVRLDNGHVVYINTRGVLKEITWPGCKEVRTLQLSTAPAQPTDWYRLEPGPARRMLLASHSDGRVFEIDAAGKVVWEHKVTQAYSATRLANGNVLIATAESKRLVEVDRSGRLVREDRLQGYAGRVRAR